MFWQEPWRGILKIVSCQFLINVVAQNLDIPRPPPLPCPICPPPPGRWEAELRGRGGGALAGILSYTLWCWFTIVSNARCWVIMRRIARIWLALAVISPHLTPHACDTWQKYWGEEQTVNNAVSGYTPANNNQTCGICDMSITTIYRWIVESYQFGKCCAKWWPGGVLPARRVRQWSHKQTNGEI